MKKLIIGAALAVMMGATLATVETKDNCMWEATWIEKIAYKLGKAEGYTVVDGMRCEKILRGHTHQILWHDDGTITEG